MGISRQKAAVLALLLVPWLVGAKCLPSGDERQINQALKLGGRGAIVELCPSSTHRLQSPILFTAAHQTLTTQGHPKDDTRALLLVEGEDQSTAIKGDCTECDSVVVRSLIVDGNRPLLLRIPKGEALVAMGNAQWQVVKDCRLYEPRGWSALHMREGDRLQCRGASITGNNIGPAGEEWDIEYDGLLEKSPRWGNPRADGISLACKDSVISDNVVHDCTDGMIVLFGSAGTEVMRNKVYSRTRVVLGGINLVDYDPWQGDYTAVSVHHNTVSALSTYLKVGINIGPSTWSDDTDTLVHSGSVTHNTLSGPAFGYGIVVSSCKGFVVTGNTMDKTAGFSGRKGETCPRNPENADPRGWLINKGSSEGKFQEEFVNGEVQHVICIDPITPDGTPHVARRLRDSPAAIAARLAEEEKEKEASKKSSGEVDAALAESLVSYQMTLMSAMELVSGKVDDAVDEAEELDDERSARSPFMEALADLSSRLSNLESERRMIRGTFDRLKAEMRRVNTRFHGYEDQQRGLLESVLDEAKEVNVPTPASHSSPQTPSPSGTPSPPLPAQWTPALYFFGLQIVCVGVYLILLRLRALGRHQRSPKHPMLGGSPMKSYTRTRSMSPGFGGNGYGVVQGAGTGNGYGGGGGVFGGNGFVMGAAKVDVAGGGGGGGVGTGLGLDTGAGSGSGGVAHSKGLKSGLLEWAGTRGRRRGDSLSTRKGIKISSPS